MNFFSNWSISTNSAYHQGGRIWILWQASECDINFLEYDAQYIHMNILNKITNMRFFATMVYAFNGSTEREPLWTNLSRLASGIQGPWAIGGDFNCVLTETERVGGSFSRQDAESFRHCLNQCDVIDSPAMGAIYTWNNKQCPADKVYSKLDRFLVNQDWLSSFPLLYAHFLPEGTFDHTPCLVQPTMQDDKRTRPFKYFNIWSLAPNFKEIVQNGWHRDQNGTTCMSWLRN
ncbi:uncharacterized protein LOC141656972 [Silene latifolia]|uniref:uncharacterized protein LOC141656972 n=1 Tax=Silene latifolia TaxID=37657 RepID=UPI003D77E73C